MNRKFNRQVALIRLYFASIMLLLAAVAPPQTARADATIVVNSTADEVKTDGRCTLREAITAANKDRASSPGAGECIAGNGVDTIVLPAGTYTLTRSDNGNEDSTSTGDLDIASSMTISPTGPVTITTISGFRDRIFHILDRSSLTLSGATLSNGNAGGDGGAIYNKGVLTLTRSALARSKASGRGGGLYNDANSTATLSNVTISSNSANTDGGGVFNKGTLSSNNVTIANNTADSDANGSGDGGIFANGNNASLKNTLIAANIDQSPATKHPDCSGTLNSLGYNLIQNTTGCALTGDTASNRTGVDARLGPLQDNGGGTLTHALLPDSPAIDAANPAVPGSGGNACETTDQRGVARPQGRTCDIGAFEREQEQNDLQRGPIFTVTTAADVADVCRITRCSLRDAIRAANARPNDAASAPDSIRFNIPGNGTLTIAVSSTLPTIADAVTLNGASQPTGTIQLDGNAARSNVHGLTISGTGSTVSGLTIQRFTGNGMVLNGAGSNAVLSNTIRLNGGAGIVLLSGTSNRLRANSIVSNTQLGIDMGGDGVTANHIGGPVAGPNQLQNFPVLTRATPLTGSTRIEGRLNSAASATFTVEFFANVTCDASSFGEGQTPIGQVVVTTDLSGNVQFSQTLQVTIPSGHFVTATATDSSGNTSEFSQCVPVGPQNDSWVHAFQLKPEQVPVVEGAASGYIDKQGQSRWYKFPAQPNSKVRIELTGLPANYDLTLYKDIGAAFRALSSSQDLLRLGAEFAPDAFSPDAFSPDAFSPDAFSPDAFSPDAFSPDAFSPDAFSPDAFSPDAFSPDAFSPDAFSPDAFSPDAFSPDAFSPDAFSPDAFSPDAFSPDAFSGAQSRSLIAVSAFDGTASEGILANTWDNAGFFYVRVRGRNGVFNLQAPFHLQVVQVPGNCAAVTSSLPASTLTPVAANARTIILADWSRLPDNATDLATLQARINSFAARPEVAGVVVNVGADARVGAAQQQADAHPACPTAKNIVAEAIRDIVTGYRALNPLQYVVIVGNDNVIPFFRYPDNAMLANEKNFAPPVRDATASQASLKLGYLLSQDAYGARIDISSKTSMLPIPDLPVGRLVETAGDMLQVLDAYLGTSNGVVATPQSSLVTGYDFLEDAARAVQAELQAGTGQPADTLILTETVAPTDPRAWTADQLRAQLLSRRHDLIFLAGHFSADSALAADYRTRLTTADLVSSQANLLNAIAFSAGCHAGYNIVNADGIPQVTHEPDWAQAFARKGATLIAGTGYQYGDTDFIEYSERLYLEFSRQLRSGSGPVSIGKALVAAKQAYLANTAQMRGIHEKALLVATLFGLPMLSMNMPGARITPTGDSSIVNTVNGFSTNPGLSLGLQYADVTVTPALNANRVPLDVVGTTDVVTATYLAGSSGIIANPTEPVLPREVRNVSVPGQVLRGVGFRGGSYTDMMNVLPLIGAPTSEIRGVHTPFSTAYFFPVQAWAVNYWDALANPAAGGTRLTLIPAQFKLEQPLSQTGILRQYNTMSFRLYYSNNTATFANGSIPALAAPPTLSRISSTIGGDTVTIQAKVVGNPAAGIQQVWVTYSALSGPYSGQWQSLDLTQSTLDSTLWAANLPLNGTPAQNIRFMVQAVNGVGLVSLATNLGMYYIPGADSAPTRPTELTLQTPPAPGAYGTQATFSAVLLHNGTPLAGQVISFGYGPVRRQGVTDANGRASASLPLLVSPGTYDVRASFGGTAEYLVSSASASFTTVRQATALQLTPQPAVSAPGADTRLAATLTDATGRRLGNKAVFFIISRPDNVYATSASTGPDGQALLGAVPLSPGVYRVDAYFSGNIPLPGQTLALSDEAYTPSFTSGQLTLLRPPDTTLLSTPLNFSNSPTATFVFTGSPDPVLPPVVTFECRLDAAAFAACASPASYTGLEDGTHSFQVRAIDTLGNVDTSPAAFTWTVDTVAPTTTAIVTGTTRAGCPSDCFAISATVTLTANEPATTQYRITPPGATPGEWQTYSGPFVITQEGTNIVEFYSIDLAGNVEKTRVVTVKVTAIPPIPLLDDFNRGNGSLGANWGGAGMGDLRVVNNQLTVAGDSGDTTVYWLRDFGVDQVAGIRLVNVSGQHQGILLKVRRGNWKNGAISVSYDHTRHEIVIETVRSGARWQTIQTITGVTLQSGDQLAARALANGEIRVYVNCALVGIANDPSSTNQSGAIGLRFLLAVGAVVDDFSGGDSAP